MATEPKERVDLDIPDLSEFKPRQNNSKPEVDPEEVQRAADANGFKTRHAAKPASSNKAKPEPKFDARSLRRTNRTAKLNIAVTEETKTRFWTLAQDLGKTIGEEALIEMMDLAERQIKNG
ncbi:MAG: hypothetical protein AAFX90_18020 [Pseudomonadota bacterium]